MFLLPLILIEFYLLITLLIFAFGPVVWDIENPYKFWFLMICYHIAFLIGYLMSTQKNKKSILITNELYYANKLNDFIQKYFWIYLLIAFVGTLISYKNACHINSYIPHDLFLDFYYGIINPDTVRDKFLNSIDSYHSNKIITIFYSSIAFIKFSLIPILVFLWNRLNTIQKAIGLFISLVPFMGTVSIGTNKLILDTLVIFSLSLFIHLLSIKKGNRFKELSQRKTIIILIISFTLFFPFYFNKSMSERNSNFQYMETVSKENAIKIPFYSSSNKSDIVSPKIMEFYIKVSTYLTQGYYGMSLALDEKFDSTYGIGHSYFLLDQFKYFFNIDLIERTYQFKVHEEWDRLVQWHSFYSQVANDVGFYGLIFIMFILGYLLSSIYTSAIRDNNIIAKTLLPLFAIMFIYMPANNQIFNFMETMFSFWILLFLWLISKRFEKREVC